MPSWCRFTDVATVEIKWTLPAYSGDFDPRIILGNFNVVPSSAHEKACGFSLGTYILGKALYATQTPTPYIRCAFSNPNFPLNFYGCLFQQDSFEGETVYNPISQFCPSQFYVSTNNACPRWSSQMDGLFYFCVDGNGFPSPPIQIFENNVRTFESGKVTVFFNCNDYDGGGFTIGTGSLEMSYAFA